MQVILDSLFARPGSAPIGGGKKGEFRDWTKLSPNILIINLRHEHFHCVMMMSIRYGNVP